MIVPMATEATSAKTANVFSTDLTPERNACTAPGSRPARAGDEDLAGIHRRAGPRTVPDAGPGALRSRELSAGEVSGAPLSRAIRRTWRTPLIRQFDHRRRYYRVKVRALRCRGDP
ncbi:hypothetical protein GCM10020366_44020 [Saccharopolyspora gregorii]|uniref:Uncharacterized protein n=1 Tax=Saccharopolyspora gregorii TaxID=33914 RepID=A0ABP6RUW9_9PSEU